MSAIAIAVMRGLAACANRLSDHQLRFAMKLVSMASQVTDELVVVASTERIAGSCGMSRGAVIRAIAALVEAGFCVVKTKEGRNGTSEITIRIGDQFNSQQDHIVICDSLELTEQKHRSVSTDVDKRSEILETLRESPAALRDLDEQKQKKSISLTDQLGRSAPFPRARDLDLLRSSQKDQRSDLRSSDLEILNNYVGVPEGRYELKSESVATPAKKPKTRNRKSALDIPERAWAAADYLRAKILERKPSALISSSPWECGWTWTNGHGSGVHIGDGTRSGLRLTWADDLRRLHGRLAKALNRGTEQATDEFVWREMGKTIQWLAEQIGERRFIVESPSALATKWDRIQEVRGRSSVQTIVGSERQQSFRPKLADTPPPLSSFTRKTKP